MPERPEPDRMHKSGFDFRPRMTRRALQFLERGEPLLVAGGPLAGKSTMLRAIAAGLPDVEIYDDISVQGLAHLMASGGSGWAAAVSPVHYRELPSLCGARLFPLVNAGPLDLMRVCQESQRDFHTLFDRSAGHPFLVAHDVDENSRAILGGRLDRLLIEIPEARQTYDILCAEGGGEDAAGLYRVARRCFGLRCKERLDLLATIGIITRFITDERAGIRLLPPMP